jgi:anti-sigma-K factor RskA
MAMTEDQLVAHRLKQLEDLALGFRQAERRVDLLDVGVSRFENELSALRAEVRERDGHTAASLARLHERLDAIVREDHEERGASRARLQIGRTVGATIAAVTAIAAVAVAVVALFF